MIISESLLLSPERPYLLLSLLNYLRASEGNEVLRARVVNRLRPAK